MMKKKSLALLILCAMLIGSILPSYFLFVREHVYYQDDYAIKVPGGWIPSVHNDILVLRPRFAVHPAKPSILLDKLTSDVPISLQSFNFTECVEKQFARMFQEYETIYWGFRDIGDKDYVLLEFTCRFRGVSLSACTVFYQTSDNDIYIIALLNDSTENNQKEFYRVVESFRKKIPA